MATQQQISILPCLTTNPRVGHAIAWWECKSTKIETSSMRMMNTDHQICKVIWLKSPEEVALEISCSLSTQVLILFVVFFLLILKEKHKEKNCWQMMTHWSRLFVQVWDSDKGILYTMNLWKDALTATGDHLQHLCISASRTDCGRYQKFYEIVEVRALIVACSYFLSVTGGTAWK